jgi:hypothetical protein
VAIAAHIGGSGVSYCGRWPGKGDPDAEGGVSIYQLVDLL